MDGVLGLRRRLVRKSSPEVERDAAWMDRMQQGDVSAYRALMDHYVRPVLNYSQRLLGSRAEAEEVTQEVFLRLWKLQTPWSPDARVISWLLRVAHNLCTDRLRRRREVGDTGAEAISDSRRPSHVLEQRQRVEAIRAEIDKLPERQRAALVMSHFEGLSNGEIAEAMEVGVEAVESLLSRARRQLRGRLERIG